MRDFSLRTFWKAESDWPVDLTKPEMVMMLLLARLIVPSGLT